MTCPTCSGRARVDIDACPRCYGTGDEPDPCEPALVAARLGVRVAALLAFADAPNASTAGRRSMIEEAAKVRAAAIRLATPSTLRDREALAMALRLIEAGADHQPFVTAVLTRLTAFGRSSMLAHTALAVEMRQTPIRVRVERRIDA